MSDKEVLRRDLATLNCHFNWTLNAEDVVAKTRHERLEETRLGDIEGNLEVRSKVYLYLSFVFTLPDETGARDFTKAEEYARKVIPGNPTQAEVYVAKANLANIFYLDGKLAECCQMLDEARQIDVTSSEAKVTILLMEIFTITKVDYSGFQRGTDLCRQAIDLDPKSGESHFALGQLLGRIRRGLDVPPPPTDEEGEAFRNAIRYWPDNALPAAYYAHCLSSDLYGRSFDHGTVAEMERHLDNAMTLAQQNDDAKSLSWCSKAYKQLAKVLLKRKDHSKSNRFADRAREAIELAVELLPNNANVLHEAGNCFWRSVPHLKDYDMAEYYLERASDRALQTHPNIWASVDLIKMRCARAEETGQPMEPTALQQLRDLLPRFDEFKDVKTIHMEIIKQHVRRLEFDQAKDRLRHLLQENQENGGDVKYFTTELDYFRTDMKRLFNEGRVTQQDHVSALFALAEMFLMFTPPCNDKARSACLDIKRLDRSHATANRMLRDLDSR